jgi:nitroreductase
MDISSVDELLTTTRAVRKRLDLTRPVSREVILECVRLAMQAPTASNAQDGRWLIVTDAEKRAAIAEIYRTVGAEYLAHAASTASDPQTRRVYESALGLTETLANVPVHVIPCLESRFDGTNQLVAASAWASIIPAGWSFLLALRSRGLGSVWTTMHLAKEREVGELLGIPATVTQLRCSRLPTPSAPTSGRPLGRPRRASPSGTPGEANTDAVLHRAIPHRCTTEKGVARAASAGAPELAKTAGPQMADGQHGDPP